MTSITWLWIANIMQVLSLFVFGYSLRKMQKELDRTPTRADALHDAKVAARSEIGKFRETFVKHLRSRVYSHNGVVQGESAIYNQIANLAEASTLEPVSSPEPDEVLDEAMKSVGWSALTAYASAAEKK